jgi:WhiB family redox-sensing transcriptional regulator
MTIDVTISTRFPIFITDETPVCATVDPEAFFPEKGVGGHRAVKVAKDICKKCPYIEKCLQWAIDNSESGIWGGTTERERRTMRHRRTAAKIRKRVA